MNWPVESIIIPATLGTSALSGVLGMAGGLILMGVCTSVLPVAQAMVVHGMAQSTSNASRTWVLRAHLHPRILGAYTLGTVFAWGLVMKIQFLPSPAMVMVGLGSLPWLSLVLRKYLPLPDLKTQPLWAILAGFLVNLVQAWAGVAGPLLDLFFVESTLDRRQVVATKAATQMLSHLAKLAFYSKIADIQPSFLLGVVLAAILGTQVGTRLLERLPDTLFRKASAGMVLLTGSFYLFRGLQNVV